MKLIDLHPTFSACADKPGVYWISHDCPECGPPYRCGFLARLNGPPGPAGIWAWTANAFSNIPPVPLDWNSVSVTPSVSYTESQAHGRKKPCNVHFTIRRARSSDERELQSS